MLPGEWRDPPLATVASVRILGLCWGYILGSYIGDLYSGYILGLDIDVIGMFEKKTL